MLYGVVETARDVQVAQQEEDGLVVLAEPLESVADVAARLRLARLVVDLLAELEVAAVTGERRRVLLHVEVGVAHLVVDDGQNGLDRVAVVIVVIVVVIIILLLLLLLVVVLEGSVEALDAVGVVAQLAQAFALDRSFVQLQLEHLSQHSLSHSNRLNSVRRCCCCCCFYTRNVCVRAGVSFSTSILYLVRLVSSYILLLPSHVLIIRVYSRAIREREYAADLE